MIKKISVLVLATFMISFVACKKDAEPPAPKIAVSELPASGATKSIENDDDLKDVVADVLVDDQGLQTLINLTQEQFTPDSSIKFDDILDLSRAASSTTAEDLATEIANLILKYESQISKFLSLSNEDKTLKIEEKLNYSKINIIDGFDLDDSSVSVNAKLSKNIDEENRKISISGSGSASANIELNAEIEEILQNLDEDISTKVKGIAAKATASASLKNLKYEKALLANPSISGKFSSRIAGAVGFSVSGDVGGKVVVSLDSSVSIDLAKIISNLGSSLDFSDEGFDYLSEYATITCKLSIKAYDDEGNKTYEKSFDAIEQIEEFFKPVLEEE